jgi:hypothetical protein
MTFFMRLWRRIASGEEEDFADAAFFGGGVGAVVVAIGCAMRRRGDGISALSADWVGRVRYNSEL